MQPHRAAAQVHKGVVTVTGVPAGEGEVVEVIVIRGSNDAERYACAPVTPGELSDAEDPLGWDSEGWDGPCCSSREMLSSSNLARS